MPNHRPSRSNFGANCCQCIVEDLHCPHLRGDDDRGFIRSLFQDVGHFCNCLGAEPSTHSLVLCGLLRPYLGHENASGVMLANSMRGLKWCDANNQHIMSALLQSICKCVNNSLGAAEFIDVVRAQHDARHDVPPIRSPSSIERTSSTRSSVDSITG